MRRSSTSRSAEALVLVALLASPSSALAAACCAGPTTSVPSRLRRDETGAAGVSVTGGATVARWRPDGGVTPASPGEARVTADFFVGYRWDAKGQVALSMPAVFQHVGSGDAGAWGAGAGDMRLSVLWEPLIERRLTGGRPGAPVPMLALGLRLPTGRGWDQATTPLRVDATGEGDFGIAASAQIERTIDRVPWSVSVGTDWSVGAQGPRPTLDVAAGLGGSFDEHWSIYGSIAHHERFVADGRTARTTVGLRLQHAIPGIGRMWGGVLADVPIPGLGADLPVEIKGIFGFAWAR